MKLLRQLSTKWYVAGLALLATVVRLLFVTKAAIWHDEGYTTSLIQHGFIDIIGRSMRDVHPPLYYLLLHGWQELFGYNLLAIRGFSVVCGVATVVIAYLLLRKLFGESTARLGGIFIALGPFAVRYSDEARMYALVALLITGASYALVTALEKANREKIGWWIVYGALIVAGLYTQYYALFIVPVHVLYVWWKLGSLRLLLRNKGWWIAHLGIAFLFAPWVPSIVAQTSRVQAGFWIPPLTHETIPNTFAQFMIYEAKYPFVWEFCLLLLFALLIGWVFIKQRSRRPELFLLIGWLVIPIVAVTILSLKQPVYHDRYFTYGSIAFYALLAIIATQLESLSRGKLVRNVYVTLVVLVMFYGLGNVAGQLAHRMDMVGSYVTARVEPRDEIVSAELYTFFDFSFYNRSSVETKLLYETTPSGYGEMSLLYDRPDLIVSRLDSITAPRVWLVGKSGTQRYYTEGLPSNWVLKERFSSGDSAVQLYEIR